MSLRFWEKKVIWGYNSRLQERTPSGRSDLWRTARFLQGHYRFLGNKLKLERGKSLKTGYRGPWKLWASVFCDSRSLEHQRTFSLFPLSTSRLYFHTVTSNLLPWNPYILPDSPFLKITVLQFVIVLDGFCVNLTQAGVIRERNLPWGNASMRSSCKAFSQLVIKGWRAHCGCCYPCAGSPGFYKKASWASQGKQDCNIPPWSLHQLLLPDLLEFQSWLPLVMNSNVENGSWINPFLPNLLLGHGVLSSSRNPDKDTN